MARYIDADALIDFIAPGHLRSPTEICFSENMVKNIVDLMPTADVVEVVRCRECKRWNTVFDREKAEYGLCQTRTQLEATRYDSFCSNGERRTDVGDKE